MKHHHHSEHGGIFFHGYDLDDRQDREDHILVHKTLIELGSDIETAPCNDKECQYHDW